MEIIKKKISLETFLSRIPALIETIEGTSVGNNGSWGKTPKNIAFLGKEMTYKSLMEFYYSLCFVVMYSNYYEYDLSGRKWIPIKIDWRDTFKNDSIISYAVELPNDNIDDKKIIGITTLEGVLNFNEKVRMLTGGMYNGFHVIQEVNRIIGKKITPPTKICTKCGKKIITNNTDNKCECGGELKEVEQAILVPYYIYRTEVNDYLNFMSDLKTKTENNCCEIKRYEDYGGDAFLNYLEELNNEKINIEMGISEPTINIPLLLTSKMDNFGMYRTYDVDTIIDGEKENNTENKKTSGIVKTIGESKLMTLRKRKHSIDDNGTDLPGIIEDESKLIKNGINTLSSPYEVNYIKNIQALNDKLYGDLIVEIKEINEAVEHMKEAYDLIKEMLIESNSTQYYEGTVKKPINGVLIDVNYVTDYGDDKFLNYDEIIEYFERKSNEKVISLKDNLINLLNNKYPDILCLKQDYCFTYNLTYYEDGDFYEDSYGNILTEQIKKEITEKKEGTVYIIFNNPKIEFTYVIGGRLKNGINGELSIDETSPFTAGSDWDGEGIWYREQFNLKKSCNDIFTVNGINYKFIFDIIDFESNEITYDFENIDFPRKNYILCNEVMYKPETYKNDCTSDPIFKDDKMLNVNFNLNEDYDVLIERGTSAAFEKHLQLSELKTWEDLENYRNGMFLNK